jgi:alpha-beta hydrolase superfamily lysophospholipase
MALNFSFVRTTRAWFWLSAGLWAVVSAAWALNPSRTYTQKPEDFNMKYEKHSVPVSGVKPATLHAWYFPSETAPKDGYTIVYSTDGIGNMADDIEKINGFISNGFSVFVYDYRGFGESSEFDIKPDFFIHAEFADDFNAAVNYAKAKLNVRLHAYGEGVGAFLTLGIGWSKRTELKRLVVDSPMSTFADMQKKYKEADGLDMKYPFAGYDKTFEPGIGLDAPKTAIEKILIIVGSLDKKVPEAEAKKLQAKQKKQIEVKAIAGADATTTFTNDKNAYVKLVCEFLAKKG